MTSQLLMATLTLLRATSRAEWQNLADNIGVTYAWIAQLEAGKIKEPGVNKIERLYNLLSGNVVKL